MMALILSLLLFTANESNTEIKDPTGPKIPEVKFNSGDKKFSYNVIIDFQGKKRVKGTIFFSDDKISIPNSGRDTSTPMKISEISSIDFLEWDMKEYKKKSYMFIPVKTRINLEKKGSFICGKNIKDLNSILFSLEEGGGNGSFIYSIFYDYWNGKLWNNSGSDKYDYPKTNPHESTLIRVEFEKNDFRGFDLFDLMKKK